MPERVLCVVAHPDDAELLAGATLAKHVAAGDAVYVLAIADGETSREGGDPERREAQFMKACRTLKVRGECLRLPDQRLDTIPQLDLNKAIEQRVEQIMPTVVYVHWSGDLNADHRKVAECVAVACRPQSGVKRILAGEIPGATGSGFAPNWYVDVRATMAQKLSALECYATELCQFPHPRSMLGVEYLAKVRGQSVGLECAEAFVLQRSVA